jgi:hypothetical protein
VRFFQKVQLFPLIMGRPPGLTELARRFTTEKARNSIFADLLLLGNSPEASGVGFQNLIQKLKIIQKLVHMFELKAAQKALSQWRGLEYR